MSTLIETKLPDNVIKNFIKKLPKAELHVHLEGTMEPEQLMVFAKRNNIKLPYKSLDDIKKAYKFTDFESFSKSYNLATLVLKTEQDFYDLAFAYFKKAHEQGVVHAEVFFDLQTYTPRNITPATIINGIYNALKDANKKFGITGGFIMCFLRHLSQEDAIKHLQLILEFKEKIMGVGLATQEEGNPPSKFENAFKLAREYGYKIVAHEGEFISDGLEQAIDLIQVDRLDHGIKIMSNKNNLNKELLNKLISKKIPLTVCPLSNIALKTVDHIKNHPLKDMLDMGLLVTINSDDPAFFGGYIAENYYAAYKDMGLTLDDLVSCARNSIQASFIDKNLKDKYLKHINYFIENFN